MNDLIAFQFGAAQASSLTAAWIGLGGALVGATLAAATQFGTKAYEFQYGTKKLVIEQRLKAIIALNASLSEYIPVEEIEGHKCHHLFVAHNLEKAGFRQNFYQYRYEMQEALAASRLWTSTELDNAFSAVLDILNGTHPEHGVNMRSVENMIETTTRERMAVVANRVYLPLKLAVEHAQERVKKELLSLHNVDALLKRAK